MPQVLGQIVAQVSGQPYATWVKKNLLDKCRAYNMEIGGNKLANRKKDEARRMGACAPAVQCALRDTLCA